MGDVVINGVSYNVKQKDVNGVKQQVYINKQNNQAYINITGDAQNVNLQQLVKVDKGYKTQNQYDVDHAKEIIDNMYRSIPCKEDINAVDGYKLNKTGMHIPDYNGEKFALSFQYVDRQGKTKKDSSGRALYKVDRNTNTPYLEQMEASSAKTPSGKSVVLVHKYTFPEYMTLVGTSKSKNGPDTNHYTPIMQEQEPTYIVDNKEMSKAEFKQFIIAETRAKEAEAREKELAKVQDDFEGTISSFGTVDPQKIKNGDFDHISSIRLAVDNDDPNMSFSNHVVYTSFNKQNGTVALETREVLKRTPKFKVIKHIPVTKGVKKDSGDFGVAQTIYEQRYELATYEVQFADGSKSQYFDDFSGYENSDFYKEKPEQMGI